MLKAGKLSSRLWVPAGLVVVYLIFLNFNPGNDAWAYAASARWGTEIFSPHHLLYNFIGILPGYLWEILGFKVNYLLLMQFMNAILCGYALYLLGEILNIRNLTLSGIRIAQSVAGLSFVVFRFATENEAYIVPVVCMMGACLNFYKTETAAISFKKGLFYISICLTTGILFHQQQILSMLAFFFYYLLRKKYQLRQTLMLWIPALVLIPLVYSMAWYFEPLQSNPLRYFLHDFYSGSAHMIPGMQQWILIPVSLIRIWIQVHGNIIPVVVQFPWLAIFAIAGFICLITFVYLSIKPIFQKIRVIWGSGNSLACAQSEDLLILLLFFLHLFFALWFGANQEFMVPLPFVWVILCAGSMQIQFTHVNWKIFLTGLCLWNLSVAGIPQRYLIMDASQKIAASVQDKPQFVWCLYEESRIRHIVYYHTGKQPGNLIHGPEWYLEVRGTTQTLSDTLNLLMDSGKTVLTDCPDRPVMYSRARMVRADAGNFWDNYKILKVFEIQTVTGVFPLHSVHRKTELAQRK